jgi:hypothetical protein
MFLVLFISIVTGTLLLYYRLSAPRITGGVRAAKRGIITKSNTNTTFVYDKKTGMNFMKIHGDVWRICRDSGAYRIGDKRVEKTLNGRL